MCFYTDSLLIHLIFFWWSYFGGLILVICFLVFRSGFLFSGVRAITWKGMVLMGRSCLQASDRVFTVGFEPFKASGPGRLASKH